MYVCRILYTHAYLHRKEFAHMVYIDTLGLNHACPRNIQPCIYAAKFPPNTHTCMLYKMCMCVMQNVHKENALNNFFNYK